MHKPGSVMDQGTRPKGYGDGFRSRSPENRFLLGFSGLRLREQSNYQRKPSSEPLTLEGQGLPSSDANPRLTSTWSPHPSARVSDYRAGFMHSYS